jgi:membrane protease YdiL (CAAX protease family)
MMRIYEMQPLSAVGLFWNRLGGIHLALGLGLGSGMSLLITAIQWSCGWARFERGPLPPDAGLTIPFWIFVLAIGAAGEELLFRGYAFQNLIRAFGPWFSVISTSVLFGLGHSANPAFSRVSLLNTALFGLLFGYAYWRTRDLWLPLGMHFAWNFTLAAIGANISGLKIRLMGLSVRSAGSCLWSGGDYGPEASLITTLVLTAVVIFLWKAPTARQEDGILAGLP